MYKGVLRSWFLGPNLTKFFNVYVFPSECEKSSTGILRLINRGSAKGLRTFPPQLCEKNEAFVNTTMDNRNPANETVNESPPLEQSLLLRKPGVERRVYWTYLVK
uniref:Uncharacterized protein n=1 Tax=Knipowitschia caucasica TaxID=637954 RepID=A0AAV2JBQ6_KNICA